MVGGMGWYEGGLLVVQRSDAGGRGGVVGSMEVVMQEGDGGDLVVLCRDAEVDAVTTIIFSVIRKNGWYRRLPKFWVVSESIPQKRMVWESIAVLFTTPHHR
jgi:hypothetical protein